MSYLSDPPGNRFWVSVSALMVFLFLGELVVWSADRIPNDPAHQFEKLNRMPIVLTYVGDIKFEAFARLEDDELNRIRGGLQGFHFGIGFSGVFDRLGNVTGSIFSDGIFTPQKITPIEGATDNAAPNDVVPPDPDQIPQNKTEPSFPVQLPAGTKVAESSIDGASISAYVGDFAGATGIFQISQSPGSYNIINNNLNITITIFNLQNETQLADLMGRLTLFDQ